MCLLLEPWLGRKYFIMNEHILGTFFAPACRNILFCSQKPEQKLSAMELAGNYWEFNFVISLKLPLDTPGGVVNTARCATAFLLHGYFSCIFATVSCKFSINSNEYCCGLLPEYFGKWFSGLEEPEGEMFLVMTKRKYCAPVFFFSGEGDFPHSFYKILFLWVITCLSAAYNTIVYKASLSDLLVNYAKQYSCFPLADEIQQNSLPAWGHWLSESRERQKHNLTFNLKFRYVLRVAGDRASTHASTLLAPASAWLHSTSVAWAEDEVLLSPSPK